MREDARISPEGRKCISSGDSFFSEAFGTLTLTNGKALQDEDFATPSISL
jgi:hypothetical protein